MSLPSPASHFPLPIFKGRVLFDVPMKDYTSIRVGGPVDVMVFPVDEDDLIEVLRFASSKGFPVFVTGAGTNLLVRDKGIRGVVVNLSQGFKGVSWNEDKPVPPGSEQGVVAGAGIRLVELTNMCKERGLSGLEWAIGIPGTLGGAVVMNAGAYGMEMKDVVEGIDGVGMGGGRRSFNKGAIGFRYRGCNLPGDVIITKVHMRFKGDSPQAIEERMRQWRERRRATQQVLLPNAGCIFKNPEPAGHGEGLPAGRLIEEVGLKGMRIGDAMVSPVHANYIVNMGNATARDVLALIALMRDKVYQGKGVLLEPEIEVVGED